MRTFRLRRMAAAVLAVSALLTGCVVHQWPQLQPAEVHTVPLRLVYAPDFYLWEHYYDPVLGTVEESDPTLDLFPGYPGTSSRYALLPDEGLVAVDIRAYPADGSVCAASLRFTHPADGHYDREAELSVPNEGSYDIVVWSHLLRDADDTPFYDTEDFYRIRLNADRYEGNSDGRDAFRGRIRVETDDSDDTPRLVSMRRPMGKFELVTTDLSEFFDRETVRRNLSTRASADDYRVVISFPNFYPTSYDAPDDRPENASSGYAFETRMTVTGTSEASLGFDYVLVHAIANGSVQLRVDVYDLEGTRVAGSATITVPIRRDHHTLLRGAFLTLQDGGGVGIDPGFNGDYNITWH